jgi:uncharacterized protein YecT (DUF1311 family)
MKTIAAILAALTLLAAAPAVAQSAPPAGDLDVMDKCLADAKETPLACLGRIQKPCLDEPGGETTGGALVCAQREQAIWDERAALSRRAVRERLSASRRGLFDAAESAWQAHRQAACAFEASIYEGGTLAKVVGADCYLRESAQHAIDLQADQRNLDDMLQ